MNPGKEEYKFPWVGPDDCLCGCHYIFDYHGSCCDTEELREKARECAINLEKWRKQQSVIPSI